MQAEELKYKYCYANYSQESVKRFCDKYDVMSPILCGEVIEDDKISKSSTILGERLQLESRFLQCLRS